MNRKLVTGLTLVGCMILCLPKTVCGDDTTDAKTAFGVLLSELKAHAPELDDLFAEDCSLLYEGEYKGRAVWIKRTSGKKCRTMMEDCIGRYLDEQTKLCECTTIASTIKVESTVPLDSTNRIPFSVTYRRNNNGNFKIQELYVDDERSSRSDESSDSTIHTLSLFDGNRSSLGHWWRQEFYLTDEKWWHSSKGLSDALKDRFVDDLLPQERNDAEYIKVLRETDDYLITPLAEMKVGEVQIPTHARAFKSETPHRTFAQYRLPLSYAIKPLDDPNELRAIRRTRVEFVINPDEPANTEICDILPNTSFVDSNYSSETKVELKAALSVDGKFRNVTSTGIGDVIGAAGASVDKTFTWKWNPKDLKVDRGSSGNTAWLDFYASNDNSYLVGQIPIEISLRTPVGATRVKLVIKNTTTTDSLLPSSEDSLGSHCQKEGVIVYVDLVDS